MFCVKCGRDGETFGGLCIGCFLNGKELIALPHHIDIERCASCEEFRIHGQWFKKSLRKAAEDAAVDALEAIDGLRLVSVGTVSEEQDERNLTVKVDIIGTLGEHEVTAFAETTVRVKNGVCKKCSRQLGNYYEATIQIRSGTKELSDDLRDETVRYVRDRIEKISEENRQMFLTKVEEVQGGVDMLISTISLAKMLAKEMSDSYGTEVKESSKLIGKADNGTDMYRMTYLLRMPEYRSGDVVIFEGAPYKLSAISKGTGKLTRLGDFRTVPIRRTQMPEMKVHTARSDIMRATVISKSRGEIQILHPVTYATVDIRIPETANIGDTANVVDVDDTIFFVP